MNNLKKGAVLSVSTLHETIFEHLDIIAVPTISDCHPMCSHQSP